MSRDDNEAAAAATVPARQITIIDEDNSAPSKPTAIHLTIPQHLLLVPGTAVFTGLILGFVRGSRAAGLRFLAENAHRAPRTVQGWYFYQKTKNYRVLLAGLKSGGLEALRLGAVAGTWVAGEEALSRVGGGLEDGKEIGTGLLTGLVFSGVYRLPLRTARQSVLLGTLVGASVSGLRWVRQQANVIVESGDGGQ